MNSIKNQAWVEIFGRVKQFCVLHQIVNNAAEMFYCVLAQLVMGIRVGTQSTSQELLTIIFVPGCIIIVMITAKQLDC